MKELYDYTKENHFLLCKRGFQLVWKIIYVLIHSKPVSVFVVWMEILIEVART